MGKQVVAALALVGIGVLFGGGVTRFVDRRDQPQHAVMWLSQMQLNRLRMALGASGCADMTASREALQSMAGQIGYVFAAADQADPVFHQHLQGLRGALEARPGALMCLAGQETVAGIGKACEACHRDYR